MKKYRYLFVAVGAAALAFWLVFKADDQTAQATPEIGAEIVSVDLPDELSANAQVGKTKFEAACASCHGVNAAGQEGVAPPLVHIIYEPSHHGDEAFQRAVAVGVRQHHWPFGDMQQVEGLTRGDVELITGYIRELQRANGIN